VPSTDSSHGAELSNRALTATGRWIDSGGPSLRAPERFLSLHHHPAEISTTGDHGGEELEV
jgi:hypothetical protein